MSLGCQIYSWTQSELQGGFLAKEEIICVHMWREATAIQYVCRWQSTKFYLIGKNNAAIINAEILVKKRQRSGIGNNMLQWTGTGPDNKKKNQKGKQDGCPFPWSKAQHCWTLGVFTLWDTGAQHPLKHMGHQTGSLTGNSTVHQLAVINNIPAIAATTDKWTLYDVTDLIALRDVVPIQRKKKKKKSYGMAWTVAKKQHQDTHTLKDMYLISTSYRSWRHGSPVWTINLPLIKTCSGSIEMGTENHTSVGNYTRLQEFLLTSLAFTGLSHSLSHCLDCPEQCENLDNFLFTPSDTGVQQLWTIL